MAKIKIEDILTRVKSHLDREIQTRQNNDTTLDNKITTEKTRAQNAEESLSQRITSEVSSREQGDRNLQSTISTNKSTFDAYVTSNNTRVRAVETALTSESNRAKGVEDTIEDALDSHKANKQNPHQVTKDQVGLGDVENTGDTSSVIKNSNLKFTSGGAYTLKEDLTDLIDSEVSRASGVEANLRDTIDSLDLSQVGSNGSYLKLISQSSGQVSANPQTFDTNFDSASDNNAPTTKATKDYVDTFGGKIDTISINNAPQPIVNKNVNLPAYPTRASLTIDNVVNTGDSNTPVSGGTTKFTTGGAYTLGQTLRGEIASETQARENETLEIGNLIGFNKNVTTEQYEITPNGYIKATKDLADNNKARLDNLESAISVVEGNTDVIHNLTVEGNLEVRGSTTTTDQETIQSQATLIVTNSTNASLVDYTGIVALKGTFVEFNVTSSNYKAETFYYKNSQNQYVLDESETYTSGRQYYVAKAEAASVYDKAEEALLIGEGIYYGGTFVFDTNYLVITLTEHSYTPNTYYIKVNNQYVLATGDFDPNQTYYTKVSQGQHLATRVDSQYLTDKHLIEWDGNSYILIDSGKSVSDIEDDIDANTTLINNHKNSTNNPHQVTKDQVGLEYVTNDRQVKGLATGTTEDHILVFGSDGYTIKDSGKTLADTGKIDSVSIKGDNIPADAQKNVDLSVVRFDIANQGLSSTQKTNAKTNLDLNNVTNNAQVKGLASGTTEGHIVVFGADGYSIKDGGVPVNGAGTLDTISIGGGTPYQPDANRNINLPSYPTQFTITANSTDGLFKITGSGGANNVSYSFAPYSSKQTNASFYSGTTNPTLSTRLNYDGYFYATKLFSDGNEVVTLNNLSSISRAQIEALFSE